MCSRPFTLGQLRTVFGKYFSVDGFASGSNSKCARFFSKRFTSGTGGVDFFMQELSSEDFFWLFPTVNLLCKAVEHLVLFRTSGVLLLLVWPNNLFQLFFPRGQTFARVGFCSSSYQTYPCGWSSGYKQALQECWILGLFAYSGEFWGI